MLAGTLADPVHGALHLANAALNGGKAVGDGQTKVVVAMRAEDGAAGARHARHDFDEELAHLVGRRVADRVRQVDRGAALADDRLDETAEEPAIASRRILGR